jgi:hypothetical protein
MFPEGLVAFTRPAVVLQRCIRWVCPRMPAALSVYIHLCHAFVLLSDKPRIIFPCQTSSGTNNQGLSPSWMNSMPPSTLNLCDPPLLNPHTLDSPIHPNAASNPPSSHLQHTSDESPPPPRRSRCLVVVSHRALNMAMDTANGNGVRQPPLIGSRSGSSSEVSSGCGVADW